MVMVNNTKLMDMPAGGNFTISREINWQSLGTGVSICFSEWKTVGCLRVFPTTLQGKDLESCKDGLNGIQVTIPTDLEAGRYQEQQDFPHYGMRE